MIRAGLLNTGVANLASMASALRRLGAEVVPIGGPEDAAGTTHLVLPGVGAFGAGMERLRARGLDRLVLQAARDGVPLLAVCLGLQLLCEESEESPGVTGLGILPGTCQRLPGSVPVPQLGWNAVTADPGCRLVESGEAAYANSYCVTDAPAGGRAAWSEHGVRFLAAVEWESVLGCQFHPELSGPWGLALLGRWLRGATAQPQPPRAVRPGLRRRIIACLDVRDGRVVKGVRFQQLRDAGDPAALASRYQAQGADELVLLDVSASQESRGTRLETVRQVRAAIAIPLTVGGGVRNRDDARALLDAGADKVSANTAAVARPELIEALSREFGRQCVVLAVDARRNGHGWEVLVRGGRQGAGRDAVEWTAEGARRGAGEVLLTSWDRDGTGQGCDEELLRAASATIGVPLIASGGVGRREDAYRALMAGADAVLAASVLHDGKDTVRAIKQDLAQRGVSVRL